MQLHYDLVVPQASILLVGTMINFLWFPENREENQLEECYISRLDMILSNIVAKY